MTYIYPIEPAGLTDLMGDLASCYSGSCIFSKYDLELDFSKASEFQSKGYDFVWLLRDGGSQIVPVRGSCEPIALNFWIDRGKDVVLFHYEHQKGALSTISAKKAKELIMLPPTLPLNATLQQFEHRVLEVLSFGCNQQHWGVFWATQSYQSIGDGDWHSWLAFFQSRNIEPMVNFMHKAINARSKLRKRNYIAA